MSRPGPDGQPDRVDGPEVGDARAASGVRARSDSGSDSDADSGAVPMHGGPVGTSKPLVGAGFTPARRTREDAEFQSNRGPNDPVEPPTQSVGPNDPVDQPPWSAAPRDAEDQPTQSVGPNDSVELPTQSVGPNDATQHAGPRDAAEPATESPGDPDEPPARAGAPGPEGEQTAGFLAVVDAMLSGVESTASDGSATKVPDDRGTLPLAGVDTNLFRGFELLGPNRAVQRCLQRPVVLTSSTVWPDIRRQARLQGRLEHPNIVPVHVLERADAGGELLLALGAAGDRSWEERLAEAPDAREEHLRTLLQLCQGVAYAHSKGVVHRDLEPSHVRLGDFGEVRLAGWAHAREATESAAVGHDIRRLGELLVRIACGAPSASLAQVREPGLREICRRALDRSGAGFPDVASFRTALEEHLRQRECRACCEAAEASLRAANAAAGQALQPRGALYAGFARALAGFEQALLLEPRDAQAEAGLARGRQDFARAALARGDLLLAEQQLVPLGADGEELRGEVRAARRAHGLRKRTRRRLRATLAALVALLVLGTLAWAGQLERDRRARAAANDSLRVELDRLASERDRSRRALDSARQEKAAAERSEAVADLARGHVHELLWEMQLEIRNQLRLVGNTAVLNETFQELLAVLESEGGGSVDRETRLAAWSNLTNFQYLSGQLDEARRNATRTLELARALAEVEPHPGGWAILAVVLIQCAGLETAWGESEAAIALYTESLALLERANAESPGPGSFDAAVQAAMGLAVELAHLGRQDEARGALEQAVALGTDLHARFPGLLREKELRARLALSEHFAVRDPARSAALLAEVLDGVADARARFAGRVEVRDLEHELARRLADEALRAGRKEEGWQHLRDALEHAAWLLARDPGRVRLRAKRIETLRRYAWELGDEGRLPEAEEVLREARAEAATILSLAPGRLSAIALAARIEGELAGVALRSGRLDEALALVEGGREALRGALDKDARRLNTRLALTALMRQRAELLRLFGDAEGAAAELREALDWLEPDLGQGVEHSALLYHAANLTADLAGLEGGRRRPRTELALREQADALFQRLLALVPEYLQARREARSNRIASAEALRASGRPDVALDRFLACGEELRGSDAGPDEHYQQQRGLARCLVGLGQLPEALEAYDRALAFLAAAALARPGLQFLRDGQLATRTERAELLLELGRDEDAIAELERCVDLRREILDERGDPLAQASLGHVLGQLSLQYENLARDADALRAAAESAAIHRALVEGRPTRSSWWNLSRACETAARALWNLGRPAEALLYAEEATEAAGRGGAGTDDPRWLDQRLWALALRAGLDRELASERAVPSFVALCAGLDTLWRETGDADVLRRWCEASLELVDLDDAEGRRAEARTRLEALHARSALRAFTDPDNAGGHGDVLAQVARRLGGWGDADAALAVSEECLEARERWAAPYPDDPLSLRVLARTRCELGAALVDAGRDPRTQLERAREELAALRAALPDDADAAFQEAEAWRVEAVWHRSQGELDAAARAFLARAAAGARLPEEPERALLRAGALREAADCFPGEAAEAREHRDAARALLEEALRRWPDARLREQLEAWE